MAISVREYRSVGVLKKAKNPEDATWESFCITPLLHHSITPTDSRGKKKALKDPGDRSNPSPLCLDPLLLSNFYLDPALHLIQRLYYNLVTCFYPIEYFHHGV